MYKIILSRSLALASALSLFGTSQLLADSSAAQDAPTYIAGEFVVTASRVAELKANVANSVTVITKEEIEASPAQDLGELLAEKGIGHVQKYSGLSTTVAIRGFSSDTHGNDLRGQILVLIDGRRAGTGNLAKLLTDNVERIEVIKGPGSVQFGSAAIGGVINVITRRGSGSPSLFLSHQMGSYEFSESVAGIGGKTGPFDYSAAISSSDRADYETGAGAEYANTSFDDDVRASVNLGYTFLQNQRLGVILNYLDVGRIGSSGAIGANDLDDYKKSQNRSLDFIYNGSVSNGDISWMARYFTGKDRDVTFDPTESNPSPGRDNGVSFEKIADQDGLQAQASIMKEHWSVTAGVDWLSYELEQNDYAPLFSDYENTGYFMLAKAILLDDKLILTGGVRFDDYDLTSKYDSASPESIRRTDNFVKNFGLVYRLNDNLRLRTSYGEGYKVPDSQEIAAYYTVGTKTYVGNPDLEPEESRTYDIGIDLVTQQFTSSLTFFSTHYDKYIERTGTTTITWENLDKAVVSGLEGDVSYVFPLEISGATFTLEPYASATWMSEYETHFDDGSPDQKLIDIPEWTLAGGLRLADKHGLTARLNLACYGSEITEYDGDDAVMKGAFSVANLSAAKKLPVGRNHSDSLTIFGSIENLFDREYEFAAGYPMPGRTYKIGLRLDI